VFFDRKQYYVWLWLKAMFLTSFFLVQEYSTSCTIFLSANERRTQGLYDVSIVMAEVIFFENQLNEKSLELSFVEERCACEEVVGFVSICL
jgi:hypothetical protein